MCLEPGDVAQLLLDDLERKFAAGPVYQRQAVAQKRDGGAGLLAQVVARFLRHDHLSLERHALPDDLADTMEEAFGPGRTPPADLAGSFSERPVGRQAQEVDGVEEVRLTGVVGAGDARERSESHVDVEEVLEARDT